MSKARKLLIISTGGTIAQKRDENTGASVDVGTADGKAFAELLGPELDEFGYEVEAKNILTKDSSNIVPDDWIKIIDTIVEHYDSHHAFLITHGTNTLGYTCAALSFALGNLAKRVVLTGSQVPHEASGSDALMNLQNAARVAMTDQRTWHGVVAVFGSKIVTGTRVKKRTEFDYDGFESFSTTQPLGHVGRVIKFDDEALEKHMDLYKSRARVAEQLDIRKKFNMNIISLTEFPGMNPKIFEVLVKEAKVDGFIFRAVGTGDPNIIPEAETEQYTNLREGFQYLQNMGIPIVVTTQSSQGVSSMDVNPSGVAAYRMGSIPAWDMSIEAMTVKLGWLLGQNVRYEHIRGQMLLPVRGEIVVAND